MNVSRYLCGNKNMKSSKNKEKINVGSEMCKSS